MDNLTALYKLDSPSKFPLHLACYNGDLNELRRLILSVKSTDPNQVNSLGFVPLFFACVKNHVECVQFLLSNGADVNFKNGDSFTQLHVVSMFGYLDCLKLILKHGVDINALTEKKDTALHLAVKGSHIDVVNCLLEQRGIDTMAKNNEGLTAWDLAVSNGLANKLSKLKNAANATRISFSSTSKLDSNNSDKINALCLACEKNNELEVRRLILDEKVNPNFLHWYELETPLHIASKWGCYNIVKFLLEHNANIAASSKDGLTALHSICKYNFYSFRGDERHLDCLKLLLNAGANINQQDFKLATPIHFACRSGYHHIAKILLEKDVNLNITTIDGENALHVACKKDPYVSRKNGQFKCVQLLLEKGGIAINSATWLGNTALHIACNSGRLKIVKLLLESGADPTIINSDGRTPWEVAVEAGYNWKLSSLKSALTKKPKKRETSSLKSKPPPMIIRSPSVPVQSQQPKITVIQSAAMTINSTSKLVQEAPKLSKVQMIIEELLKTESTYTSILTSLVKFYLVPLEDSNNKIPNVLRGQSNKIFGNIRELQELHSMNIFPDMMRCYKSPGQISHIFNKYRDNLIKLYTPYCIDTLPQTQSFFTVNKIDRCEFVIKCQQNAEHNMPLSSYLATPFQRITKYPLLLKELEKACNEDPAISDMERRTICANSKIVSKIAEQVNSGLKPEDQDTYKRLSSMLTESLYSFNSEDFSYNTLLLEMKNNQLTREYDQPSTSTASMPIKVENEYAEIDETVCNICNKCPVNETAVNCGHTFCKDCIEQYRRINDICPDCDKQIEFLLNLRR